MFKRFFRTLALLILLAFFSGACLATPATPPPGAAHTAAAQTWAATQAQPESAAGAAQPTTPPTSTPPPPLSAADFTATPTSIQPSLAAALPSQTPLPLASLTAIPLLIPAPTQIPQVGPRKGALAPDFSLSDARTGAKIRLSALRGQPVMIIFWATWCGYCQQTMPSVESAYQKFKDAGFMVLAVDNKENQKAVASYGNQMGLSFNLLLDSKGGVANQYEVSGFPTSFFIQRDGLIAHKEIGAMTSSEVDLYASVIAK